MRLLLISSEFPPGPGGMGTHAYQLTRHLMQLGWDVVVITPQDYASEEEVREFNESLPFKTVRPCALPSPLLKVPLNAYLVSKWIKKWNPDIILASGQRAVWLAGCITQRYRLPWVAVGHGGEIVIQSAWQRRLTRWSFQRATAVVCVSQYTWQQLLAIGVRPRMGRVIPNGADATRFKILSGQEIESIRTGLGLNGAQLLLTVGNVTERKGQDVVIRALPRILRTSPNVHYLVAGIPTRKKEFATLAQKLHVTDYVHFLGRIDAATLVGVLNTCDVFVMTSRHTAGGDFEGYGIAVTEAALCGKPAVVTNNSGLAEAILEGVTGFAVPEDNEIETADAILSLINDENQKRRMGNAARKRALDEQTWDQRVREYDALLRRVL